MSDAAAACPNCGNPIAAQAPSPVPTPKKASTGSTAVGCFAAIAGIWVVGMLCFGGDSTPTTHAPTPKEIALSQVTVAYTWQKGGFDNVMLASFTFTNPTDRPVKDIEVTCTHSAPSGTKIDSNKRTIYVTVPAKGKKHVPEFNMGFIDTQAVRTNCQITDLVVL